MRFLPDEKGGLEGARWPRHRSENPRSRHTGERPLDFSELELARLLTWGTAEGHEALERFAWQTLQGAQTVRRWLWTVVFVGVVLLVVGFFTR